MVEMMLLNLLKAMVQWFLRLKKKAAEEQTTAEEPKILTPKQLFQRLPIKAGNNYENLLNEIRQIVYSLYQSKEITKKIYCDIIKSVQL